ncbi:PepSY domain-containing protein [Vreelandella lutescens]|uniref:PepSY domain-containing protein n=1 Tax=Vreelandella lutescens TaxID=1602943 RepID=A0ABQ1NJ35_9GAMM|nr:Cys/Met metabolism pyridoxal-phosphate-dependent enzyme [Halomonas lutescens]GGC75085.1 hypothetical protein GCM10011382_01070 [Halomonas lutescens]
MILDHVSSVLRCALLSTLLLLSVTSSVVAQAVLSVDEAIAVVQQRYQGELLDIEMKSGRGWENSEQVYELRLLTAQGNVLKIRIAREDGRFLEIDGRGQIEARLPPPIDNGGA